eukprot:NODE_1865_length_710_cov_99.126930_g1815_i0.p1 GENE.NODE_1865_length_710_cov_99.126930_g1815_i0~~NODE_1865_length_710_cov_99.126930_g1815_i0.p1  ORF type:complete len:179 (-),score=50.60 NODE_1865_length_710_cov_99.126930_g1815_i0:113-649(-)
MMKLVVALCLVSCASAFLGFDFLNDVPADLLAQANAAAGDMTEFRHKITPKVSWCNTSASIMKIKTVNWVPHSFERGENVTLTVLVQVLKEVKAGDLTVEAELNGIHVLNHKYKLCPELKKAKIPCPVKPGPYGHKVDHKIPKAIFGHLKLHASGYDEPSGDELFCVNVEARFGPLEN